MTPRAAAALALGAALVSGCLEEPQRRVYPPHPGPPSAPGAPPMDPVSRELANTINHYRAYNGLPPIPISPALTRVAELHTRDMADHPAPNGCNGHSWSNAGPWSSCCYTPDHAQAACMWNKPREITGFFAAGFEIGITGSTTSQMSPRQALDNWRSSPAHHDVILSRGTWTTKVWRSLGASLHRGQAAAWFALEADPYALPP